MRLRGTTASGESKSSALCSSTVRRRAWGGIAKEWAAWWGVHQSSMPRAAMREVSDRTEGGYTPVVSVGKCWMVGHNWSNKTCNTAPRIDAAPSPTCGEVLDGRIVGGRDDSHQQIAHRLRQARPAHNRGGKESASVGRRCRRAARNGCVRGIARHSPRPSKATPSQVALLYVAKSCCQLPPLHVPLAVQQPTATHLLVSIWAHGSVASVTLCSCSSCGTPWSRVGCYQPRRGMPGCVASTGRGIQSMGGAFSHSQLEN